MHIADLAWPSNVPRLLWIRRECPLCSSIEFKTAESHPLDRLLRLLMFVRFGASTAGDDTIGSQKETLKDDEQPTISIRSSVERSVIQPGRRKFSENSEL